MDPNPAFLRALADLVRAAIAGRREQETDFARRAGVDPRDIGGLLQQPPAHLGRSICDTIVDALASKDRESLRRRFAPPRAATAKPRVFVSSTFLDQEERRRQVIEAIQRIGLEPVAMERFAGREVSPVENDTELAASCELYLGILAYRYGTPPPGEERSHTELEYDAATAAGRDRIVFTIDRHAQPMNPEIDADPLPARWDLQARLQTFVDRVERELTVPRFRSDADLVNKVWHSLHEWMQRRNLRPEQSREDRPFDAREQQVSRYRDAILAEHGTLRMIGFASTVRAPIQTTALYVDLQAAPRSRDDEDAPRSLREHGDERLNVSAALQLAAERNRDLVVVRGYAGSGKTTFVRRLAVACVQQGGHDFALPEDALPVVIPVRRLDASDIAQPIAHWITKTLPPLPADFDLAEFGTWLDQQSDYPLLILLDGLDEAPSATARGAIAQRLTELARDGGRRIVLTSRFAGYTDDVARTIDDNALLLDLQPFTPAQTEQFIENWYRIVECHDEPLSGKHKAEVHANDLIQRLRQPHVQASRVYEFTANPLLLTILCIIHRDSAHLPEHRERLYREVVHVLLESWRRSKQLTVHLSAEQSLKVLMPVARFLHQQTGRTRATAAELAPVMQEPLRRIGWTRSAEDFLLAIRDDSGILTGHSGDSYGFLHLGIQEFLTACALDVELREPDEFHQRMQAIAARYGDPWWREVLLLLLALPERPFFRHLFRHVVALDRFGRDDAMLEDSVREANEPNAEPFSAFLTKTAGEAARDAQRASLRHRQLAAVRALKQIGGRQGADLLDPIRAAFASIKPQNDSLLDVELWGLLGLPMGEGVSAQPRAHQSRSRKVPSGISLVEIPAGEFDMGTPPGKGDSDERPQRRVRIAKPFWLAATPVTNAQYRAFVEATGHEAPRHWRDKDKNADEQPVVGVSWDDAQAFCRWAGLRLPTEAEWEYACRAGTTTEYWFDDDAEKLEQFGWFGGNSGGRPRPVAGKPASPWGLFDMHGNVYEWCEDWKGDYGNAPKDGSAQTNASGSGDRVLRGGSWGGTAGFCRSAFRSDNHPGFRGSDVGFRPASSSP